MCSVWDLLALNHAEQREELARLQTQITKIEQATEETSMDKLKAMFAERDEIIINNQKELQADVHKSMEAYKALSGELSVLVHTRLLPRLCLLASNA
jgi:hypothetical protein